MENIMSSKLFTTRQGTVLLGVIAAVIAAIALLVYLNHYRSSVKGGGVVRVLVAQKVIPKGTPGDVIRTTSGLYAATNIPKSSVESGAIVSPATLAGKVALTEVDPNQQLTASDFGTGTTSIAGQIPANMRAVTISLESPNQVGGQIAAGSPVDVWIAFNGQGTDGVTRPIVRELYQNVKVLAVAGSGGNVTLEANPTQAGTLIFAAQNATIYLTLRPAVGTTSRKPPVIGVGSLLGARALRIGR